MSLFHVTLNKENLSNELASSNLYQFSKIDIIYYKLCLFRTDAKCNEKNVS